MLRSDLKVAIVHDYLNQYGGAERCLELLHEIFPQAPIFTLVYDKKVLPQYQDWDIRPSFLQHIPGAKQYYTFYLLLFPLAVKTFNLSDFNLIISISHAWVKGIRAHTTPHISYCLTPIRYAWDLYHDYKRHEHIPGVAKTMLPALAWWLRKWDRKQARTVSHFIAISQTVARRIRTYYDRSSAIIYPPVDTSFYCINGKMPRENYYLTVSRLKAYKRIDLIIKAFNVLGYPLKVIGNGPALERLKGQARGNITFLNNCTDEDVLTHYQRAKGFVYAGLEDFGLVIAEAQSCGLPVIAYGKGGAGEIIQDGMSGVLYNEQTVYSLINAVDRFETMNFDPEEVRACSLRFDRNTFKENFVSFIDEKMNKEELCLQS